MGEKNVKITKRKHAFYDGEILSSFNPELQLKNIESAIKSKLMELLTQLEGSKFVTTLALVLKKIKVAIKKIINFYPSSKVEVIINESDINDVFQSIYTTIITNIQKYLGKGSG